MPGLVPELNTAHKEHRIALGHASCPFCTASCSRFVLFVYPALRPLCGPLDAIRTARFVLYAPLLVAPIPIHTNKTGSPVKDVMFA